MHASLVRGCRLPSLSQESSLPSLRKIDCVRLPVDDLDKAIRFYGRLGHQLIWRRPTQAGLRLPESDAEIVLQTEHAEQEIDFLVEDAEGAAERFTRAGGNLIDGPFDIEVGRCAVVEDPFGNRLVLLDLRYGPLT
jgi:catechol 2,3-dioxygenase-like lactoylglutathione lyase family enzyme